MPGLGPGIHEFLETAVFKSWMAGTSPAMTARAAPALARSCQARL